MAPLEEDKKLSKSLIFNENRGFLFSPKTQKFGSRPPLVEQEVEQVRTIIETMREHDEQCRGLVGKDFALITVRRYESCTRYLAELIKLKYDKEDLPITE